jgi:hypothetical protein
MKSTFKIVNEAAFLGIFPQDQSANGTREFCYASNYGIYGTLDLIEITTGAGPLWLPPGRRSALAILRE